MTEQDWPTPSSVHDRAPLSGSVVGNLTRSLVFAGSGMVEVNWTRRGESTPKLGVAAVACRLLMVCNVKLKFLVSAV